MSEPLLSLFFERDFLRSVVAERIGSGTLEENARIVIRRDLFLRPCASVTSSRPFMSGFFPYHFFRSKTDGAR